MKFKRVISGLLVVLLCGSVLVGCKKEDENLKTDVDNTVDIIGMPSLTQMTTLGDTTETTPKSTTTEGTTEAELTTTEEEIDWAALMEGLDDETTTRGTTVQGTTVSAVTTEGTTTQTQQAVTTQQTTIQTTIATQQSESQTVTTRGESEAIPIQGMENILNTTNTAKSIYYDQLSERDKKVYNTLVDAVLNFKSTATFDEEIPERDFDRVFCIAYFQNPELFWWSGKLLQSADKKSCTLMYIYSKEQAAAYQKALDKKCASLLGKLTTDMTDLQKVIVCHNWMCVNNVFSKDTENSKNVYGSIVCGIAQCEGYAKGMLYLMNKIGVPALLISGSNKEGGSHAWVKVKINGEWTNMDPTFDDSVMDEPVDLTNVSYRYCGVPDAAIYGTTHFDINCYPGDNTLVFFTPPECTTYSLNADINYGSYAETYEEAFEKLRAECLKAVSQGKRCAHVKIATNEVYLETLKQLVNEKHIFDIRKAINEQYGDGTVTSFAVSPENKLNYVEVTMTYGKKQ